MWFRLVTLFPPRVSRTRNQTTARRRYSLMKTILVRRHLMCITMSAICARVGFVYFAQQQQQQRRRLMRSDDRSQRWLVPWTITDINRVAVIGRSLPVYQSISLMRAGMAAHAQSRNVYDHRVAVAAWLWRFDVIWKLSAAKRTPERAVCWRRRWMRTFVQSRGTETWSDFVNGQQALMNFNAQTAGLLEARLLAMR